jgi:NAD(P)-dependent dehydrogenase (short-subunit alcohol dehydrogenase family)
VASLATPFEAAIARYGMPEQLRSDNGPECITYCIPDWLKAQKIKTLYISRGSLGSIRVGKANYADEGPALQGLVQGLSRDLGLRGITINNVQPGPVDTDMNPAEGEFAEMLKKLVALPRYAHVDEIAAMVAYLAGSEAGFVTGASLMIDGGFAA